MNKFLNKIDWQTIMQNEQTNIVVICICAFLAILVLFVAIYRQFITMQKSKEVNRRLEFWVNEKQSFSRDLAEEAMNMKEQREKSFKERVLLPLGEQVGTWMADKVDYASQKSKRLILIKAGIRGKNALQFFYAIKVGFGGILAVGFFIVFSAISGVSVAFIYALIAGALGFVLPNFIIDSMAGGRQANIDKILPDALDLLVICTESGMGIDQALLKVAANLGIHGKDLVEEIILTNREMHLGQDRQTCWKNLGERTNSEELKSLASIISQAEQRGGQVARILREQSEFMRLRRRQGCEEKAAQLTVKMMIPMALFIFPVIMCVTLGPPIVKLATNFSGTGQ